ncbi:MAG: hypothetical protein OHK0012_14500 [Synechococcales cyanobacterium]
MIFNFLKPKPVIELAWVLPGRLAVGEAPNHNHVEILKEVEIEAVLGLCAESEVPWPATITKNFQCQRFPLPDSHYAEPLTVAALSQAVSLLKSNLDQGLNTYIHCQAGVERSPTVCLAYLCRYQNLELMDALQWVKRVNPRTAIIPAQLEAVRQFITTN